ncbi:MAG: outer membrane beta-barrel protein [Chitinophagaceae bacterium]|nr:outer membrane beta-barrel protein [Chitinophagaceae bacterium]
MFINSAGYASQKHDIAVAEGDLNLGTIRMQRHSRGLDEVKIVAKIVAVAQKDDTVEYAGSAYKVNINADAAELVRKMPGIELNGKEVRAHGETVLKVMVDGKPFFGDDPWATLKGLPADVIQKVQVYNDMTDQERITGFREGPQSKTINIVTKPDRKNGIFGNIYSGGGMDNNGGKVYGTGMTLNRFAGPERLTVTSQANNINIQNFTEAGVAATGGSSGVTSARAAGVNYTNKYGKADVSGSYFFNNSTNDLSRRLRRTYVLPGSSGQVYDEVSPSHSSNVGHRINMRISYMPDTLNTLLLVPSATFNNGAGSSVRNGATTSDTLLNSTSNSNNSTRNVVGVGGNVLYSHRFLKRGRTISAGGVANYNIGGGETEQKARNNFAGNAVLNSTINQRIGQHQNSRNVSGNIVWTEPAGQRGLLKAQYELSYAPSESEKTTYDSLPGGSEVVNNRLSSAFRSINTTHKTGLSYQFKGKNYELSGGVSYQSRALNNDQRLPDSLSLHRTFSSVLPVATIQYRFSKTRNLQCNYGTSTSVPSMAQLQDVIDNTDPLHLSTGNPSLRQPFTHTLTIRYNESSAKTQHNFFTTLTVNNTQNFVAQAAVVANTDTVVGAIILPAGAQLSLPVNVDGSRQANGNLGFSVPLRPIKCRVNLNVNAGMSRSPAIINGIINYQQNRNAGLGVALNSNISENVDFSITSNTSITKNSNPVNELLTSTFVSEVCKATIDLTIWKGIVISSAATYQANFGLSAGFNRNFILWNAAVGKKLFKKRQGDIRLSVFDILNQNNNIQRTTTESYVQDIQTNILQRYFLLTFSYKISSFGK